MMSFPHRHLLGIKGLSEPDIHYLLDQADEAVKISRQREKKTSTLRGLTQINLFFESSTRTQASFELAGKRLGADVMNMSVANSSVKKGETLVDTAMTLNAMRPGRAGRAPFLRGRRGAAVAEGRLPGDQCRRRCA
jgi:aspartate carbamoyltransferase catalytic subunit